jgi:hypothetical protein
MFDYFFSLKKKERNEAACTVNKLLSIKLLYFSMLRTESKIILGGAKKIITPN